MQWNDIETPPKVPLNIRLSLLRESVARRPHDVVLRAELGDVLIQLGMYRDAAAEFETAEGFGTGDFCYFGALAKCYLSLDRPDAALQVCERWNKVMPNCSELYDLRGLALRKLGRSTQAQDAFLNAITLSHSAFEAAECLLSPLASDPDGTRLLALCDQLPSGYANSTVVRAYRAIALSRVGCIDGARSLVDLERYVARIWFEPPSEFGGVAGFNALLADEILRNSGLRYKPNYGFPRTEHLNIFGARAFPVLAQFLRGAIERYVAEFPQRGLDAIMPKAPREGFLASAGNVVQGAEGHQAHMHKFAYVSGVYHVSVPQEMVQADDRAGALVLGSCDGLTGAYVPCWKTRDIKPVVGVATIFPSHVFHSVVPTRSERPRIAVPFDLCGTATE